MREEYSYIDNNTPTWNERFQFAIFYLRFSHQYSIVELPFQSMYKIECRILLQAIKFKKINMGMFVLWQSRHM